MKTLPAVVLSTCVALLLTAAGGAQARPMRMCPMIYMPVCAISGSGHHKTFSNSCVARNAGARIVHRGECRKPHR